VLDSMQAGFLRLLGREADPLGAITPEQLKAVLKSIEGKYNSLRDENKRLKAVIDAHVESIDRLKDDLEVARESIKPQGMEALQAQRDELVAQLEALQRQRAMERSEWEAKLAGLENKLIDAQRLQLGEESQREDLLLRHQAEVIQLREELAHHEAQVSRQEADIVIRDRLDSEKQALRVRLDELTDECEKLVADRDKLEASLRDAENREVELRTLLEAGPAVTPQAPPKSSAPSESPDRRELLARLLGGGQ